MNKTELISEIQNQLGGEITKAAAERALEAILASIKVGIQKDKVVQLVGFGSFLAVERPERMGVNPQTGKSMTIKASKSVKFKPSSQFKDIL